jgi:drug/metabolite transporter (DMT)-like permease
MQTGGAAGGAAPLRMGAVEWGLITLQSIFWGSSYFFIALVQGDLPAFTIAALRTIPASLALLLIVLSMGYRLPATLAEWRHFILFSAFSTLIPFVLIVWGQSRTTGGMAAILNASAPLFGIFLAHVLTQDEKLSWNKLAGTLVGITGVSILVGYDFAVGSAADILARVALLTAPLLYVCANLYARRNLAHYPAFVVAAMQMIGSIFVAFPLAIAVDQPWTLAVPALGTIGSLIGMGVFGSALAALCHFTVLQRAGATNATLVTLIMPLTPILLGAAFLGEHLAPREIAGALVIAAALIIIDGRVFGFWRAKPSP